MKFIPFTLLVLSLTGCVLPANKEHIHDSPSSGLSVKQAGNECPGTLELPAELAGWFEASEDEALLNAALGTPKGGGLCQGRVYQAKKDVEVSIYRAWNSSNQNSRLGQWWAFNRPDGKVARYRYDYEICYQWSPLDKLSHCKLTAGSRVVIGTGQSAECSQFLTYPASAVRQIYIEDAFSSVSDCKEYDAVFDWQPVSE